MALPYSQGPYLVSINSKGELRLPASIAEEMKSMRTDRKIAVFPIGGALLCYSENRFKELFQKIIEIQDVLPGSIDELAAREDWPELAFNCMSKPVEIDRKNRIRIPKELRPSAGIALVRKARCESELIFSITYLNNTRNNYFISQSTLS